MLTARARYALRALLHLAGIPPNTPEPIAAIAEAQAIPHKFLENILLDLSRLGLVRSRKGPGGGYLLARPANEIRVLDVIRGIDGPIAPLSCLSVTAFALCSDCRDPSRCGVKALLEPSHRARMALLETTTLDQGLVEAPPRSRRPTRSRRKSD